jgi:hypothetical protein
VSVAQEALLSPYAKESAVHNGVTPSWWVALALEGTAYPAALSVDAAFETQSTRVMRCMRVSVTDFFAPFFATYYRPTTQRIANS